MTNIIIATGKRLALAALLTLGVFGASAGAAQACATPGNVNGMASALASGVNQARLSNGLSGIGVDSRLMAAAQTQACHVALTGVIDHRGPGGNSVMDRVTGAGYRGCLTAENLAWGFPDAGQIVNGWLGSPGHRSNMLNARVDEIGVGIAQGAQGPVWVLVLARGC